MRLQNLIVWTQQSITVVEGQRVTNEVRHSLDSESMTYVTRNLKSLEYDTFFIDIK